MNYDEILSNCQQWDLGLMFKFGGNPEQGLNTRIFDHFLHKQYMRS